MLARSVALDDHTKHQHMAKVQVQVHLHPVDKNEWAISSVPLLHLPYAATTAKSPTTNPKSPMVLGPQGMPRNSTPFPAEASAPLKVPKDEKLIRGSTVGFKSREKDPVLKKNTKEIQIKKNCLSSFLISYHKSGQIDLSALLPKNPFHKVSSLHFQTGFSFLSY